MGTERKAIEVFNKWIDCRDAFKADKQCDMRCEECEHNVRAEEMDMAVIAAISALKKQEQDRWIPVTERPPEGDGKYLVTFESGYAEDYGFDPIGIAPFEVDCEGFGIWQESFDHVSLGSLGSEWVDIQVTAWRPLPEAFEAEDES